MADISKEMAVQLAEAIVGREKANGILVSQWLEYAQAAFKLGRNSGLEDAALCMEEQDTQAPKYNAKAIRSLKDNTP